MADDISISIDPSEAAKASESIVRSFENIRKASEKLSGKHADQVNRAMNKIEKNFDATSSSAGMFSNALHKMSRTYEQTGIAGQGLVNSQDQLSASIRRTARSVAILQGPLGPVAGRITTLGVAVGDVGVAFTALGIAITGGIATLLMAGRVGERAQSQFARLEQVLDTTNHTANQTSESIESMARNLGRYTLASTQNIRDAATQMVTFRKVTEESFGTALNLAQDLAAVGFGSVEGASRQLAKALEDPQTGLTALRRSGVSFTAAQREMVMEMYETGRVAEGQGLILKEVASQVEGAGEAAATGVTASFDTLGEEFKLFLEEIGTGVVYEKIASGIDIMADATRYLHENMSELILISKSLFNALITVSSVKLATMLYSAATASGTLAAAFASLNASLFTLQGAMSAASVAGRGLTATLALLMKNPLMIGATVATAGFYAFGKATEDTANRMDEMRQSAEDLENQVASTIDKLFYRSGELREGGTFGAALNQLDELSEGLSETDKQIEYYKRLREELKDQRKQLKDEANNWLYDIISTRDVDSQLKELEGPLQELTDAREESAQEIAEQTDNLRAQLEEAAGSLMIKLRKLGTDAADSILGNITEAIGSDVSLEQFAEAYQTALRQFEDLRMPRLPVDQMFIDTKKAVESLEPSLDSSVRSFAAVGEQINKVEDALGTYREAQEVINKEQNNLNSQIDRQRHSLSELTKSTEEHAQVQERLDDLNDKLASSEKRLADNEEKRNMLLQMRNDLEEAREQSNKRYLETNSKSLEQQEEMNRALRTSTDAVEDLKEEQKLLDKEQELAAVLAARFGENWRENSEAMDIFTRSMDTARDSIEALDIQDRIKQGESLVESLKEEIKTREDLLEGIEDTSDMRFMEEAATLAASLGNHELAEQIEELIEKWKELGKELKDQNAANEATKSLDKLKKSLDPVYKATMEYANGVAILNEAQEHAGLSAKEYEELLDKLEEKLWDAVDAAEGLGKQDPFEKMLDGIDEMASGMRTLIGTMQSMEDQGTKSYRQMQVALDALNAVQATSAVLRQLDGGDPYTAFSRGAAMAAAVASLGYSVSSLGGGLTDDSAERQAEQSTGTVLGSPREKSESIQNALDITAEATEELVGINKGILSALTSMQEAVASGSALISRGTGDFNPSKPSIEKNLFDHLPGIAGDLFSGGITKSLFGDFGSMGDALFFPNIADSILGSVGDFLGGESKTTDRGFQLEGGTLGDMRDDVTARGYQDYKYKEWAFGSTKKKTKTTDLDQAVNDQFALIFDSMYETMEEAGEVLGISSRNLQQKLNSFVIEFQEISTKDLSAEEKTAEIEAMLSSIFDDLAEHAFGDYKKFQKAGEGLGETLARVAVSVQTVNETAKRLGLTLPRVGMELTEISTDLVESAGGIGAFIETTSSYFENFYSEEEKVASQTRSLRSAFSDLNMAMPQTREGFRSLVDAQDLTTESGRETFLALMELSEAFDDLRDSAEKLVEDAFSDLERAVEARRDRLKEEAKKAIEEIEERTKEQLTEYREGLGSLKDNLKELEKALSSIANAAESLRDSYDPIQESRRRAAISRLENALAKGDVTGIGGAAETAAQIGERDFATKNSFKREQARTLYLLGSAETLAEEQVSHEEQAVRELESLIEKTEETSDKEIEALKLALEDEMAKLDLVLEEAQNQLNALNDVNSSVLSVRDAVDQFRDAMTAVGSSVPGPTPLSGNSSDPEENERLLNEYDNLGAGLAGTDLMNVYEDWKEEHPDVDDVGRIFLGGDYEDMLPNGYDRTADGYADTRRGYLNAIRDRYPNIVPEFAEGGTHSGGVRMVGERGPEIELTGPSKIISNQEIMKALANNEKLVKEIRELRRENRAAQENIEKNTREVSQLQRRWDRTGMPEEREIV